MGRKWAFNSSKPRYKHATWSSDESVGYGTECRGLETPLAMPAIQYLPVNSAVEGLAHSFIYSRLSLSRLRLSRITAYLEEKIWSLF